MLFISEFMKNMDILLREAGRDLKDIPVFGGTGLLSLPMPDPTISYVFDGEDCYRDFVLAVLFHGENLHIKASYNYGWTPVGKKMTITKTDGDFRVLEIDHKPAMNIYGKYLGLPTSEMIQVRNICEFPLISKRKGLTIARVPSFGDKEGALNFGAPISEGDEIQFSYGAQARIFSEIYTDGLDYCKFVPQGMLLVICMNRVIFLKEQERHEVDCYQQVAPELAFFHGNSEIYYCNEAGGELNSALVAIGIREGEAEKREIKIKEDPLIEDRVKNNNVIPLEYRVMQFMNAVTEDLWKLSKKANAANEAKSAFLSSMSHEIRTPINAVLGMDEMILRESEEENTLEYAENIRVAGNTLLGLVNDILDFSKIEAGKMELVEAEYETASTLHDLVTMISLRAENKGLALKTEIDKELPTLLYGDEVRLKQVITNILTNAVKYTEEGSVTLSVKAEKKDEEHIKLTVHVKDTGIGIKEEDIPKLFSAFERIEEERNRNIEGTGLGMNITNRLLSMMDSELSVSSVYGEGSDFYFTVVQKVLSWKPIGDMDQAWKTSVQSREKYQAGFTAPKAEILAVDDTAMNLTVLKGLLKPQKIKIDTASSGEECLEMITQKKYDIIFLDHRMPKMDGIETRERMDGLLGNKNQETPVIALTANAVSGANEEYLRAGFTDYLTKPINTNELEKMLRTYLPEEKLEEAEASAAADSSKEDNIPDAANASDSGGQNQSGYTHGENLQEVLSSVDGLDYYYANLHLPTDELLEMTVRDFYGVITLHADRLEEMFGRLPEKNAMEEYRIQVHGMKSSAATIGIIPLAGMAKVLEDAARDEDFCQIKNLHGAFIDLWRDYKNRFMGILGLGEEKKEEKPKFEKDILKGLLDIIQMSMEEFDIDKADETMEMIKGYSYPENMEKEIHILQAAISDVDSDAAIEIIEKIKKSI